MLDPLDYARFIESAWLLGPKAYVLFCIWKTDPVIIFLQCVLEANLQPKRDWNFMQRSALRAIGPTSTRYKVALLFFFFYHHHHHIIQMHTRDTVCGTDNIPKNISHTQYDNVYEEYSMEYCESHKTLLWIWIMWWYHLALLSSILSCFPRRR